MHDINDQKLLERWGVVGEEEKKGAINDLKLDV